MPTTGVVCADSDGSSPLTHRLPVLWWAALASLLVVEIVVLSVRLDTAVFASIDAAWAAFLNEFSLLVQLAISAVVAWLVFGGSQLVELGRSLQLQSRVESSQRLAFVAHLVALAAFYQVSTVLFSGAIQISGQPALWTLGWLSSGILTFALWLAAFIPLRLAKAVGKVVAKPLLFCSGVAIAGLLAGRLTETLWGSLAKWNFEIVSWLLSLMYSDIVIDPAESIIGTDAYAVRIAAACSGYEGIGMVALFLVAFIVWFRRELRFPQCLLLIPVGIVAIWIANCLRIAALIALGSSFSREIASGGFHSQAGWLAFNAIAVGLAAVAWHSPFFSKGAAGHAAPSQAYEYPAAPYLVPFLMLVATAMVVGAFSAGGFDYLYGVRVLTTLATLAYFWGAYRRLELLEWSWSWTAVAIGAIVFALWMLLEPWSGVADSTRSTQASSMAALPPVIAAVWIVLRIVGSVLVVPVVEELAFRGYLTRRLIDKDFASVPLGQFSWFSCIVSSVVFGLMHGRWLAGSLAGLLFAVALYRRGRLSDAVLAHATANALVTAYVLATGNWATWS